MTASNGVARAPLAIRRLVGLDRVESDEKRSHGSRIQHFRSPFVDVGVWEHLATPGCLSPTPVDRRLPSGMRE
jgi:hypothetical protein